MISLFFDRERIVSRSAGRGSPCVLRVWRPIRQQRPATRRTPAALLWPLHSLSPAPAPQRPIHSVGPFLLSSVTSHSGNALRSNGKWLSRHRISEVSGERRRGRPVAPSL